MASVLSRIQIIMEANTANYNNELRRARENSNTTFGEIGKSATNAALVVGAALAGMGAVSVKTAMSFETAMAEINKTVDFTANYSLPDLKKELEDLTKVMPLTFEELAKIAAAGGQSGVAAEGLKEFTETIAKMSIAFDISADETADAMAKISSSYNVPIENVKDLGDAINEVSNSGAVKANQIVDFMLRVGQSASNLNIAGEAAAALGGALIDAGGSVEVVGTAMKSIFTDMSSTEWLDSMSIILTDLGIDVKEYAKVVKTDGLAAFMMIREGIMSAENPVETLNTLFDEAGGNAASLFSEGSKVEAMLGSVGAVAGVAATHIGSLDKEYQAMADTAANGFVLLQNSARLVSAAAGEAFLPAVRQMTDAIIPLVQKAAEWAKANPELIQQITLIGGSLIGTILGLKLAVDGFTAAKDTIDGLKLAYAAIGTTMGLTVLGLGILLAAGVLVYQNWDEIKQVVKDNEVAFSLAAIAIGAVTSAILVAKAPMIFAAAQSWAMAAGAGAWTLAAGVASGATWAFNAALAVLTSPITLVVAAIGLIAYMGYQVVKNWAAISAGLNAEFNKIKSYVLNTVATMQAAWDRGVANTRSAIINIKNTIVTTLKELPSRMLQVGKDIVNGLINGIKQGASGVATAIGSMASSAVAKAKSVLDIRSPSRVMKTVGEQTAQGMADGIKKGKKAVVTEAQKMAADAVKAVRDGVASLKREIALFGNDSPVAALKYDISVGKFAGADTSKLMSLTHTKEQLESTKKLADANRSVQDTIDGLIKQQALFGNNSSLASLMYDIEHTDRFKDVTKEVTDELVRQTAAFEQLGMTAKATNAIKERFAQLEADRKSATNAFDGLEINGPQTEAEKLRQAYQKKMDIVDRFEQMHTDKKAQAEQARATLTEGFNQSIKDLEMQKQAQTVGSIAAMFGMALGETSKGYKAMFLIQKTFDFASAQSASFTAIAKAWSSAPFPANLPAVGMTTLQTGIIPAAIQALNPKGFKDGGYTGSGGLSDVAGLVHKEEFVANAPTTRKYRPELEAMHNGTYDRQSSAPNINVNVTVSMDGNSNVESNSAYGKQIGQGLAAVVVSEVNKMTRPNGTLDRLYAKR